MPSPVRVELDGARVRRLCRTVDYQAALFYYPPGVHHPDHEHAEAGVTFLLSGGFMDDWEGRESTPSGSRHGFRPEGARHNCRFGRDGALILSVVLRNPCAMHFEPCEWRPSGRTMADLFAMLFARAAPAGPVIDDLLAAVGTGGEQAKAKTPSPPRWLRRAAEEMSDDPTVAIAAVARRAGVHRVYLSRAFQAHFGLSPTHYRLHCKAAAAMRLMIDGGEPPGMAAVAAGFADQAHWTRASRALAGITPVRLRRLLDA